MVETYKECQSVQRDCVVSKEAVAVVERDTDAPQERTVENWFAKQKEFVLHP